MTPHELTSSAKRYGWIIFALCVGFAIGHTTTASSSRASSVADPTKGSVIGLYKTPSTKIEDVDFKQFWDLWKMMKERYYLQPVTDKQLFYGALQGLAGSVNDPYTVYFDPKVASDFASSLEGKFEGIGAEIGMKDGQLQVVAPLPGTPAERGGILAGDLILNINGTSTESMSVEQAVTLIRGPKGTPVTLTIFRMPPKGEKAKESKEIKLIRDTIHVESVKSKMLDNSIAYIEVTNFNADTQDGFDRAVRDVTRSHPKGLILDLRNNPGGFLDTAVSMASEWLGTDVIVKERRQGVIVDEMRGNQPNPRLKGVPTVILVNQGSASASEIVSGALQDAGAATLIGTKTFGKGVVQDVQDFPDGSSIKMTIAEWLTPKERLIQKLGLEPNELVERTADDYEAKRDPQLERAIGFLLGKPTSTRAQTTTSSRE